MSNSAYTKIFTGNFIIVQKITALLEKENIQAIIKDESESARLAGFGASIEGLQDIYVENDWAHKASSIIENNIG